VQQHVAIIRDRTSLAPASSEVVSAGIRAFRRFVSMTADLELLDRWCAGDESAGNELLHRHFAALYGFFEHETAGEVDDFVVCPKPAGRKCDAYPSVVVLSRGPGRSPAAPPWCRDGHRGRAVLGPLDGELDLSR
jgi:hypothetical protein